MIKDDCIFCKLANGAIPTNMLYEDEDFAVILDAAPATKGHALIIPKQHSDNLYELPDETAAKVMPLAKKIAMAEKKAFDSDGINILQNNEPAAGQSVIHFHVHVIPRKKGDFLSLLWTPGKPKDEEQKKICQSLADELE
jgi:histidine triad (HIT) family protein